MPIRFEFYTALALVAALLLGFTVLLVQIRDPGWGDVRWRRAALHFVAPLLFALALLVPPFQWAPPIEGPVIYYWQLGLGALIVILLRSARRLAPAGGRPPLTIYALAALYLLLLLASLVYPEGVLTFLSLLLLIQLFTGIGLLITPEKK